MKNIAKILCFVLYLVLIISVMGVSAFADESETYVAYTVDSNYENRVDYETLTEAMANVPNGGFVYLVADVTESIARFSDVSLMVDYDVVDSVTINNTYTDNLIDFDNVSIAYGITLNVNTLYTGGSTNSIDGTVNVAGDYIHGYDANTMVNGTLNVGGELSIVENTDMYCGLSIYGTVTADTITITTGALSGYWATLSCNKFVAEEEYGVYFDFGESDITVNNATINANLDFKAVSNGAGAYTLVAKQYVAEVDGVKYEDFVAAIAALQNDSVLTILSDITIDGEWHRSGTGKSGKYITKSVTIEGNWCTLTFTGKIVDPNYAAIFSFFGEYVTINNLTIDATFATDYKEIINAKYNVELNNCYFYGNGNRSAVMYGQGAGTAIGTVTASINGCYFSGVKNGVTDNMNAQDAKSVTITDSTFDGCKVNVSAAESIVFTGNSVYGNQVIITTYSATNTLDVTATGNELDTNYSNEIKAATGTIQSDFYTITSGDIYIGTNGNWFIGNVDTGYKAVPEITVVDGYWVINGLPTEYRAEAIDGVATTIEIRDFNGAGYWFINGQNTKIRAQAIDGVGIAKIEKNEALSNTNVSSFTISFTDGTNFTFTVNNGLNGDQGAPGVEGPMGKPGDVGAQGAPGFDGEDNSEVVQATIIIASVCVAIALIVLLARAFKKDRFALPF